MDVEDTSILSYSERRMYYTVSVALLLMGLGFLFAVVLDLRKANSALRMRFFRPFRVSFIGNFMYAGSFFVIHIRSLFLSTGNPNYRVSDEDCNPFVVSILILSSTLNMFGPEYFWYDLRMQLAGRQVKTFAKRMRLILAISMSWILGSLTTQDFRSFEGIYCFAADSFAFSRWFLVFTATASGLMIANNIRHCFAGASIVAPNDATITRKKKKVTKGALREVQRLGVASTVIHVCSWTPFSVLIILDFFGIKNSTLVLIAGWATKLQIPLYIALLFSSKAYQNAKSKQTQRGRQISAVGECRYVQMTVQEREEAWLEIAKKSVFSLVECVDIVVDLFSFVTVSSQAGYTIGVEGALFTISFSISFLVGLFALFAALYHVKGILREMKHGIPVQVSRERFLMHANTGTINATSILHSEGVGNNKERDEQESLHRNLLELTVKRLERERFEYKVLIALAFLEDFTTFAFAFYRLFFTFYTFDSEFVKCLGDGTANGLISFPMDCFTPRFTMTILQLITSFAVFMLKLSFIKDIYRVSTKLTRTKLELKEILRCQASVLDKFKDVADREVSRVVELRKVTSGDTSVNVSDIWLLHFLRKAKQHTFDAARTCREWSTTREKYRVEELRENLVQRDLPWDQVCQSATLRKLLGVQIREILAFHQDLGGGVLYLKLHPCDALRQEDREKLSKALERATLTMLERASLLLEHFSNKHGRLHNTMYVIVDAENSELDWFNVAFFGQSIWSIVATYPINIKALLWRPSEKLLQVIPMEHCKCVRSSHEILAFMPHWAVPTYMGGTIAVDEEEKNHDVKSCGSTEYGERLSKILGTVSILKLFQQVSLEDFALLQNVEASILKFYQRALRADGLESRVEKLEREIKTKMYFQARTEMQENEVYELRARLEVTLAVQLGYDGKWKDSHLGGVLLLRAFVAAKRNIFKTCYYACRAIRLRLQWELDTLHSSIVEKKLAIQDMEAFLLVQRVWPCTPIAGWDEKRACIASIGVYASQIDTEGLRNLTFDQTARALFEWAECARLVADQASLQKKRLVTVKVFNILDHFASFFLPGNPINLDPEAWRIMHHAHIGLFQHQKIGVTRWSPLAVSLFSKALFWKTGGIHLYSECVSLRERKRNSLEKHFSREGFLYPPRLHLRQGSTSRQAPRESFIGPLVKIPIVDIFDSLQKKIQTQNITEE